LAFPGSTSDNWRRLWDLVGTTHVIGCSSHVVCVRIGFADAIITNDFKLKVPGPLQILRVYSAQ
jgi:hypothetical protein